MKIFRTHAILMRVAACISKFRLPLPDRGTIAIAILILGTGVVSRSGTAEGKANRTIAIVDVSVVPMDAERTVAHQTVVIRGGKIASVGPSSSTKIPQGAERIEGKGKFVMPGLIDAHVHLMSPDDLLSYAAFGVTTVVNMSGTPSDLRMRREVREGRRQGPNIYTAGPTIDGYPPLNEVFVTAETPAQGDAIVVSHKHAGYDFIKVYGTLRPDVFRAIADACKREHMTLVGHVNRQMPTKEVFATGQVMAAHAEDLLFAHFDHPPNDEELAKFADEIAGTGITVTANIALNPATVLQIKDLDQVLSSEEAQFLSAATYSRWIRSNNRNVDEDPKQHLENVNQAQALDLKFVRLLHERKVPIILGTDASAYGFPGESVWKELEQTEAAGLSRYESLATATRNAGRYLAKYVDPKSSIGVVKEGAAADLLVLNTNPLETKLERAALDGVVLRGEWRPKAKLEQERAQLRERLIGEHKLVVEVDERLEKGDLASARQLLAQQKRDAPLIDEWVLLTKARKHEAQLPVAIEIAKLYTEQFPDRFSSHQLLADLLQKSANNGDASSEAKRALEIQPHGSTAEAILERAGLSGTAAAFTPVNFGLHFLPESDASTAVLRLQKNGETWGGSLKVGDNVSSIKTIVAGGDQLWFKVGENWQEKEVRLRISPGGDVSGSWWSAFGRNGTVSGSAVKN